MHAWVTTASGATTASCNDHDDMIDANLTAMIMML
jgi:hypothetical protein